MSEIRRPVNLHDAYHAHVYFDAEHAAFARDLCQQAGKRFDLIVGRFHEKKVGPHPVWSCQLAFGKTEFAELVPWLDSARGGLSVFVHPLTGDDIADHTAYASWLGDSMELDLTVFTD